MKTLTMKMPDGLLVWLENEARRAGQPKSALVREILQQHRQRRPQSALDLAADLCGCVKSGFGDLARNKKHLKGLGPSSSVAAVCSPWTSRNSRCTGVSSANSFHW